MTFGARGFRATSSPFKGFEMSPGASLDRAQEIAVRDELDAVERCIEEAQSYLTQIRILHRGALDEFNRAQGE
jgi:hypothetical protein